MDGEHIQPNEACRKALELIDPFVSGELSTEEEGELLRHLSSCPDCAQRVEDRMRIRSALKRAVQADQVPSDLQGSVMTEIRRSTSPVVVIPLSSVTRWSYAAAALILLFLGVWGAIRLFEAKNVPPPAVADADTVSVTVPVTTVPVTRVLNIGLIDHVNCAIKYKSAEEHYTYEQMAEYMGPDYIGLVPLLRERVRGYEVVVAHQCTFGGRHFIHLILRDGSKIVSLAITKKGEDSFGDAAGAMATVRGIPLFQARLQNLREFEVVGFETREFLAFIVSDLPKQENLELTETIAPGVHDFLDSKRSI